MGTISSNNKKQQYSYTAFFDLDNTIVSENSSKLLIRLAYEKKMISNAGILKALWLSFLFKFNLKDTEKIIAGMVKWLSGISRVVIDDLSSEVFTKHLLALIPDEARSEIKMHKEKNAELVILSSALEPVCRSFADYLEMDNIICTELEVNGDSFTGRTSGKLCFGNEKLVRLKQYCEKIYSDVDRAWYYGDSIYDLPALEAVGHPVCINPDRQLRKKAIKKGWTIYDWKRQDINSKELYLMNVNKLPE
jgi:HAD superfamily hydrolase (TIGR01490 family)